MNGAKLQIAILNSATLKRKVQWGEVVSGYKVFPCHDHQLAVLGSDAKYTFAFAGTGGGKTIVVPLWLFKRIEKDLAEGRPASQLRYLVVSPSVPIFESSQLKGHILETFRGTLYEGVWHDQKKTYTLPNGVEIVVKTVGDGSEYDKLTGGQYNGIVLDECWKLSVEVWEEVQRRSNINDAPILGVTTPNVDGWLFSDVQGEYDLGNPNYRVIRWRTADNPAKSPEEHAAFLDEQLRKLGEAKFNRMYCGEFTRIEGLVYGSFSDPKNPAFPVIEADPRKGLPSRPLRFFGCIDWGYKPDPAAILIVAECEDGISYVVEEFYANEKTHDELAVIAKRMVDRWAVEDDGNGDTQGRFIGFACDVSQPAAAKAFRQMGISIRNKKVADILGSVEITDMWFRAGRLKVYACCKNTVRELRGYQWSKDRSGDLKENPVGKNDHACDALRYGVSTFKYYDKPIPVSYEAPTEADQLEKVKRYDLLPDAERVKEQADEAEKKRFIETAFGTDDDDDPCGVWTRI